MISLMVISSCRRTLLGLPMVALAGISSGPVPSGHRARPSVRTVAASATAVAPGRRRKTVSPARAWNSGMVSWTARIPPGGSSWAGRRKSAAAETPVRRRINPPVSTAVAPRLINSIWTGPASEAVSSLMTSESGVTASRPAGVMDALRPAPKTMPGSGVVA